VAEHNVYGTSATVYFLSL